MSTSSSLSSSSHSRSNSSCSSGIGSPESLRMDRSASYRGASGSFKKSPSSGSFRNASASFKQDIPPLKSPSRKMMQALDDMRLDIPSSLRVATSVNVKRGSTGSFKLEIPDERVHVRMRRKSCGNLRTEPQVVFRRETGSFKLEIPGSSAMGYSADTLRRALSNSCKLHSPQVSPSGSVKSTAGSMDRDHQRSLKLDTGSFQNPPGSFNLQTLQMSPSASCKRGSTGSFKLTTPRNSPSGSFKSPSGSYQSPSGSYISPSESLRLELPRKDSSGSFNLEPSRKGSAGSFNLEAPRKGSSGSFKMDIPRKSSSGSFKLEAPKKSPSGSISRESTGSLKLDTPGTVRKDSLGNLLRDSQGSSKLHTPQRSPSVTVKREGSFKLDPQTGALVKYSPSASRKDVVGSVRIDSSKEGTLVVTHTTNSPLHQQGSKKPEKIRIVCPLEDLKDSKIRIELKMD